MKLIYMLKTMFIKDEQQVWRKNILQENRIGDDSGTQSWSEFN